MSQQLAISYPNPLLLHTSKSNPRKHFHQAAIDELSASIQEHGILQPLTVRASIEKPGAFEIVAGARRYYAASKLINNGIEVGIPCIVQDLTDEQVLEIQIVENLQREDISAIEEAVGFRNLMQIKHMDIKEIAARVGKTPTFVAQRLKLCDLIDPIQQFLYDGHLMIKDAMQICMLPADVQHEMYTDQMAQYDSPGDVFELNRWTLSKYQNKLNNAPFDINDPGLIKKMGPCTTCSFNSASSTVLFPDMIDNPICSNTSCFKNKCDVSFKIQLEQAKEDPAVILIHDEYHPSKETLAIMKGLDGVLGYGSYDEIQKPEPPEREDYDGNNDSTSEDEQEYLRDYDLYRRELQQYNDQVASGKYLRAYFIGGNNKGHYTYIKIKKGKGNPVTQTSGSKTALTDETADDIKSEIQRLKDREKRAKQLDDAKVWDQVKVKFDPINNIKDFTDHTLTQIELTAAAYAIYNKLHHHTQSAVEEYLCGPRTKRTKVKNSDSEIILHELFHDITPLGLNELLRVFFLDTLPPSAVYHGIDGDAAIMMKVAEAYWPDAIESIGIAQRDIADRRAKRVEARITDLQKKLKEVKKSSAAASKATTPEDKDAGNGAVKNKKGKGIKALIPETQTE